MRRFSFVMGCVVAVLLVLQVGTASATVFTLTAADYGMIREKVPGTAYPADFSVYASGSSYYEGAYARDGMAAFDLTSVTVGAGEAITSVKLQVYVPASDPGAWLDASGFSSTAALLAPQAAYTGMTWTNTHGGSPTYTYTALDSLGALQMAAVHDPVTGGDYVAQNVWVDSSLASAADIAKLDAVRTSSNKTAAFLLLNSVGGVELDPSLGFSPKLIVTVGTPEPATSVLLITGLLGLLAYAWRKRK